MSEITDLEQVHRVLSSNLRPWAEGKRDRVVRLVGEEVSGRRVEPGPGGTTVVQL